MLIKCGRTGAGNVEFVGRSSEGVARVRRSDVGGSVRRGLIRDDAAPIYALRRLVRRFGLEVRRVDPDAYLGVFATRMIAEFGLNCVVDVGANVGQFGTMLRNDGYRGEIFSFEPVQESFEQLVRVTDADRLWRVVRAALGVASGEVSMNVLGSSEMSSLLPPDQSASDRWNVEMDVIRLETVRLYRLDEMLPGLAPDVQPLRAYLKVDTQGTDLDVIKGAEGILDRIPVIQTELSFKPLYEGQVTQRETMDYLGGLGYELAGLFPVVHDHNGAIVEADAILTHRDLTRYGDGPRRLSTSTSTRTGDRTRPPHSTENRGSGGDPDAR